MNSTTATFEIAGFTPYPIEHIAVSVTQNTDSLMILWDDGRQSEYHFLWLRDNCPCTDCVSTLTREQVFEICDVPLDIAPTHCLLTDDGRLNIGWNYGDHQSRFHPGWLRAHCYSEEARSESQWRPKVWDKADITHSLPTHQYQPIMQDESALLNWLRDQRDYGIALLKGVDTTPDTLVSVANRISFIRETNFGTVFNVKAKPDANTSAYTTLHLPLHTDLPTRELQPGLQFLHCLVNDAEGGESILVDGFKVAEHIRQHFPEDFHSLCNLPMNFYNKDKDSDYRFRGTALVTDSNGAIIEVRLANFLRGPLDLPSYQVSALYRAYRCFMTLAREARFQFYYRLNAGDLIVFDNRRVLHARNEFNLQHGGRHLQGCYVDRDELLSRIRVLERTQV